MISSFQVCSKKKTQDFQRQKERDGGACKSSLVSLVEGTKIFVCLMNMSRANSCSKKQPHKKKMRMKNVQAMITKTNLELGTALKSACFIVQSKKLSSHEKQNCCQFLHKTKKSYSWSQMTQN